MKWIDELQRLERKFDAELFEQLVVELAAMYDQRQYHLTQSHCAWRVTRDIEGRLVRMALCIHEIPQDVLKQGLASVAGFEEGGDLYSLVRVLCMQPDRDLLTQYLIEMDLEDPGVNRVICDALRHGMRDDWKSVLPEWLSADPFRFSDLVYKIVGWRRWPVSLLGSLHREESLSLLWALGRVGDRSHGPFLRRALSCKDPKYLNTSAIAMLRIGEMTFWDDYLNPNTVEPKPWLAMGLGWQNRKVEKYLLDMLDRDVHTDIVLALGLSGRVRLVDVLLEWLQEDALADTAALAIELITGVGVYDEIVEPARVDDDALFDEEKDDLDHSPGQLMQNESIEVVKVACRDPAVWRERIQALRADWKKSARYLFGRPHSPGAVIQALQSEKSLVMMRELVQDELVVNYQIHTRFEHDMWVDEQDLILAGIDRSLKKTKWFGRSET